MSAGTPATLHGNLTAVKIQGYITAVFNLVVVDLLVTLCWILDSS